MRIAKSFHFDAAHSLPLMPEGHKCKRLHGHTYRIEIYVEGSLIDLKDDGMIVDYDLIAKAWAPIHDELDHRHLNDVPGLDEIPTTEVLAWWIYQRLQLTRLPRGKFSGVRLYESSTTFCEVP